MCVISIPHLSFAAGFGTFFLSDRLPGFIGPFPPPLLIRLYVIFPHNILSYFFRKSREFCLIFLTNVHNSPMDFFA